MPYTLAKWILWLLLAALVGGVIGYLLRGLRPSATRRKVDQAAPVGDDLDRLRRKANEAAVATADRNTAIAERDALTAECDALRAQLADCRAANAAHQTVAPEAAGAQVHGLVTLPTLSDDDLAQGAALLGRSVRRDDLTSSRASDRRSPNSSTVPGSPPGTNSPSIRWKACARC